MINKKKIRRAIISVYNKKNLNILLPVLKKFKIEIISSGGSYKAIRAMNFKCKKISEYTKFNEILNGRVKTLHPKIHGGILNIRNNKKHQKEIKKNKIKNIDLVIINFYPFEENLKKKLNVKQLIDSIDIGGSTLIRAAAKNFNDVTVISEIEDYKKLAEELKKNIGSTSLRFRKNMSAKAFNHSAYYDSIVAEWFNKEMNIKFPKFKTIHGKLKEKLRYGENPHQEANIYETYGDIGLKKIHGKELSFNNYNDLYSALTTIKSFGNHIGTVIVKHANPCGVSIEKNSLKSYKDAIKCDPISAFGGIIAINSKITKKIAYELNKNFFEVIIFKSLSKDAFNILKRKKNLRLVDFKNFNFNKRESNTFFGSSFMSQDEDTIPIYENKFKIVTKTKPTKSQIKSLKFAFQTCRFVKSNAIVLVKDRSTIGIGSGQPNRVDSCQIAINKALKFSPEKISYSVAASDAFFPFPDGIITLIKSGVKAIIQPGGSIRDKEIIKVANKNKVAMVFTNTRHFKH